MSSPEGKQTVYLHSEMQNLQNTTKYLTFFGLQYADKGTKIEI